MAPAVLSQRLIVRIRTGEGVRLLSAAGEAGAKAGERPVGRCQAGVSSEWRLDNA